MSLSLKYKKTVSEGKFFQHLFSNDCIALTNEYGQNFKLSEEDIPNLTEMFSDDRISAEALKELVKAINKKGEIDVWSGYKQEGGN